MSSSSNRSRQQATLLKQLTPLQTLRRQDHRRQRSCRCARLDAPVRCGRYFEKTKQKRSYFSCKRLAALVPRPENARSILGAWCPNGRYSRRDMASETMHLQNVFCGDRAQRKKRIHRLGSEPQLAAFVTNGWSKGKVDVYSSTNEPGRCWKEIEKIP